MKRPLNIKLALNKLFIIILSINVFFINSSCKNTIAFDINRMLGEIVNISDLELIYAGDADSHVYINPQSVFKIIVYIDSSQCVNCEIARLVFWNDYYESLKTNNIPVYFVFNQDYNYKLYFDLKKNRLQYPAFVDKGNSLKKTFHLSDNIQLRTFLTKQDTIIVVGDPLINPHIFSLYEMEIKSNLLKGHQELADD